MFTFIQAYLSGKIVKVISLFKIILQLAITEPRINIIGYGTANVQNLFIIYNIIKYHKTDHEKHFQIIFVTGNEINLMLQFFWRTWK